MAKVQFRCLRLEIVISLIWFLDLFALTFFSTSRIKQHKYIASQFHLHRIRHLKTVFVLCCLFTLLVKMERVVIQSD